MQKGTRRKEEWSRKERGRGKGLAGEGPMKGAHGAADQPQPSKRLFSTVTPSSPSPASTPALSYTYDLSLVLSPCRFFIFCALSVLARGDAPHPLKCLLRRVYVRLQNALSTRICTFFSTPPLSRPERRQRANRPRPTSFSRSRLSCSLSSRVKRWDRKEGIGREQEGKGGI